MKAKLKSPFYVLIVFALLAPSCMVLDGGNSYRKTNKCCGIIKCDLHRRSQVKKHKGAVNASKKYQKKEQRIKRGY